MSVRRAAVAGVAGLTLLIAAGGCSKVGEKIAEEAVEQNSNCTDVDIDASEGGFSGNCEGEDIDVNASGNAELPADWPADLAPPENIQINAANEEAGPPRVLSVVGTLDGDLATIRQGIEDQLVAAGYTIDEATTADAGVGGGTDVGTITATSDTWTALVTLSDNPSGVGGNLGITYTLTEL